MITFTVILVVGTWAICMVGVAVIGWYFRKKVRDTQKYTRSELRQMAEKVERQAKEYYADVFTNEEKRE